MLRFRLGGPIRSQNLKKLLLLLQMLRLYRGFPWKLLFQKIFSKNPLNLEWIFYLKTVEL